MMATEYDRLVAQRDAILDRERRRIEGALAANETLKTITERAAWYRDGCEGLEDRDGYYTSGDCARDAASDLETALSEIRVLERVIALMRGDRPAAAAVVTLDAVKAAIGFLNRPQREMVLDRLGFVQIDALDWLPPRLSVAQEGEQVCRVPPAGWHCTRKAGHDGPCAAVPIAEPDFSEGLAAGYLGEGDARTPEWRETAGNLSIGRQDAKEPATPPPALQTCTEPFSQGAGLRQKVQDLADLWLDPEFWKDTGNLMDSRDCAGYLIGILRELDEAEPLALASLINRLENDYAFECPGGPLRNCVEWQQLKAALEPASPPPALPSEHGHIAVSVSPIHAGEEDEGPLESMDLFICGRGLSVLVNVLAGERFTYSVAVDGQTQEGGTVGREAPTALLALQQDQGGDAIDDITRLKSQHAAMLALVSRWEDYANKVAVIQQATLRACAADVRAVIEKEQP